MRVYAKSLVVVGVLVTLSVAAIGLGARGVQSDWTKTIITDVHYRLSSVQTLTGRALVRYIASDRIARVSAKIQAAAAAERLEVESVEMPPLGKNHACLLDFDFDFHNHRWRSEIVDLTNTGSNWTAYGPSGVDDRNVDPSRYYGISLCDGETVYEYVRRHNVGFVHDYEPGREPDQFRLVQSRIIATVERKVMRALEDGGFLATHVGEETMNDMPCQKVRVHHPGGTGKMVARLWIAPDLAQAIVRQEVLSFAEDDKPWHLRVVTADDFVELLPGFWCPKLVKVDRFEYRARPHEEPGEYIGRQAWFYTEVIQWDQGEPGPDSSPWRRGMRLDMTANVPLDIMTPYVFPFDAMVNYSTAVQQGSGPRNSPSLMARIIIDELLPEIEPDPLGSEITPESAATLLEAEN